MPGKMKKSKGKNVKTPQKKRKASSDVNPAAKRSRKPTMQGKRKKTMDKPKPPKKRKSHSRPRGKSSEKPKLEGKRGAKKNGKGKQAKNDDAKPKQKKDEPARPEMIKTTMSENQDVWEWWKEKILREGVKWESLEHNGPLFAPPYEPLPKSVKFVYNKKPVKLSPLAEEVAGMYAKMIGDDYTKNGIFNHNFFDSWRDVMTQQEAALIKDFKKCDFSHLTEYYILQAGERKSKSKEEKLAEKAKNQKLADKYGFCVIDGHPQKVGNFRIEPPGLFRGRGKHPKMGMLKKRVEAEDITINIGEDAEVPRPPPGHKWKEIVHDNTVCWLAKWQENVLGATKYIMLNPSSKMKGLKDWQKYEVARKLRKHVDRIRSQYTKDFDSEDALHRQRAVALYLIDRLALRAGNEKEEGTADTVGCCSLRVEHVTLHKKFNGESNVVTFDFLGKDSIRYVNSVPVEKKVFENLQKFMYNKYPEDNLFDELNTAVLNKYLNSLVMGLTAKVFRTYNASATLQNQLDILTKDDMSTDEKVLAYNRANRVVAVLCNHQRAEPKGFSKTMDNLKVKVEDKLNEIKNLEKDMEKCRKDAKNGTAKEKKKYESKQKRIKQLEEQMIKLKFQVTDKEENKLIALGTSKLNYLDPRISIAWCRKWKVPFEKIYNKTQRDKFRWAIEMATAKFRF